jgi:hypothetical protein
MAGLYCMWHHEEDMQTLSVSSSRMVQMYLHRISMGGLCFFFKSNLYSMCVSNSYSAVCILHDLLLSNARLACYATVPNMSPPYLMVEDP